MVALESGSRLSNPVYNRPIDFYKTRSVGAFPKVLVARENKADANIVGPRGDSVAPNVSRSVLSRLQSAAKGADNK
jgi:hypothetical protein